MKKAEALRRRIIKHLREEWRGEGGSVWNSFAELAKELGEPLHNVKREVRRLHRAGVLYYTQLFTDEMKLAGGGYILEAAWDRHAPGREGDPE